MRIELQLRDSPVCEFISRPYDPKTDDIRSIIGDICQAMAVRSRFLVAGFGQDRWPVDVEVDLPVFLEQLPRALRAISDGDATEIDFYEQGIERSISLTPLGNRYSAACVSRTSWQPNPSIEQIDRNVLEEMMLTVREEFMRAVADIAPGLVAHPWLRSWLVCS